MKFLKKIFSWKKPRRTNLPLLQRESIRSSNMATGSYFYYNPTPQIAWISGTDYGHTVTAGTYQIPPISSDRFEGLRVMLRDVEESESKKKKGPRMNKVHKII